MRLIRLLAILLPIQVSAMDFPPQELPRLDSAGKFFGELLACKSDYKAVYSKFMEIERKKDWSEDQISFISAYVSIVQARTAKPKICDLEKLRKRVSFQLDSLNQIKVSRTPKFQSRYLVYDLGKNAEEVKGLITIPVGDFSHAIMALKVQDKKVIDVSVLRIDGNHGEEKFDSKVWQSSDVSTRRKYLRFILNEKYFLNEEESVVISKLGKPNWVYERKYGYMLTNGGK